MRTDLFKGIQELPGSLILECIAVIQEVTLGRFLRWILDHLVVLLLGILLYVLISIVLKDLLVGQLGVYFHTRWFLAELLLLRDYPSLFISSTHLLSRCGAPRLEELEDILHTVVRKEKSSHRIEQVLIFTQVFLAFDQLQLKLGPYLIVFKRVVVFDVIYQLL
jgi:hypothetical protein